MMQTPALSRVEDRKRKAEILGAVLDYVSARKGDVPFVFLNREMNDYLGIEEDIIHLDVMGALSALAWAGAIEITPHDPADRQAFYFGADTSIRATGPISGFTHFERVDGPDEEEVAA